MRSVLISNTHVFLFQFTTDMDTYSQHFVISILRLISIKPNKLGLQSFPSHSSCSCSKNIIKHSRQRHTLVIVIYVPVIWLISELAPASQLLFQCVVSAILIPLSCNQMHVLSFFHFISNDHVAVDKFFR